MKVQEILEIFPNKKVSQGGEVYLNFEDGLRFIAECEKFSIPLYRIEILQITDSKTLSSLDKIIDFDNQGSVYTAASAFIKDQMDKQWNYACFVVGE